MSAKLVIGANGFLGSHVTRQLVAGAAAAATSGAGAAAAATSGGGGHDIRVMVRPNAMTVGSTTCP